MKIAPATLPASVRASFVIILVIAAIFLFSAMRSYLWPEKEIPQKREEVFSVIVTQVAPQSTRDTLTMKGTTAANKTVIVRAETPGQVAEIPAQEGQLVQPGDLLCRLAIDSRRASTAEARAALEKAKIDYEAATNLSEQGFQSSAAVANAKAALDRARAGLNRSSLDLKKTRLSPPFTGILTQYFVDQGDFLPVGSPCAEIKELDPIKVIATVSEKDVNRLAAGAPGILEVGNETVEATVSFVARAANSATRTFTVELEAANTHGWRDGETAIAVVATGDQTAYRLPRNALVLNDEGILGVRATASPHPETSEAVVRFLAVDIIRDDDTGVYVTGPEKDLRIITRGQNYVRHGQTVKIAQSSLAAGGAQPEAQGHD